MRNQESAYLIRRFLFFFCHPGWDPQVNSG